MTQTETQLLELLKARSIAWGEFRLASGGFSNYYIDVKLTEVCSQGAHLIGEVLFERTKKLDIDALGGLEVGAVPLVTAAVIAYQLHGRSIEGFWVRDHVKSHGTRKLIEGKLGSGARVAIVDDVVTKGSSVVKSIKAVRDLGCTIAAVFTLVDRLEGAAELFREHEIEEYHPIFTIRDLGVEFHERAGTPVCSGQK